MAGIIHRKPGLIVPGSPEWDNPGLCDLFGGGMMAGAGPTCQVESAPTQRKFFLRGTGGATGTQPTTDDMGNALTWAGAAYRYSPDYKWSNYNASAVFAAGSGLANYVRTTSNIALSDAFGNVTIAGWYKFVAGGGQYFDGADGMGLGAGLVAGAPRLKVGTSIIFEQFGSGGSAISVNAASVLPYNQWVFVTGSRNGVSGLCAITVNGAVVVQGSPTWPNIIPAGQFYVYGNITNNPQDFNVLANDVRLWTDARYTSAFTPPTMPPC